MGGWEYIRRYLAVGRDKEDDGFSESEKHDSALALEHSRLPLYDSASMPSHQYVPSNASLVWVSGVRDAVMSRGQEKEPTPVVVGGGHLVYCIEY